MKILKSRLIILILFFASVSLINAQKTEHKIQEPKLSNLYIENNKQNTYIKNNAIIESFKNISQKCFMLSAYNFNLYLRENYRFKNYEFKHIF